MPGDILTAKKSNTISQSLEEFVLNGKLSGVVSLIEKNGEILHYDQVGHSDLSTKKPIQFDTIFRMYSMTKPIVSVALMILFEQGLIDLFAPISDYISEFKNMKVFHESGTHVSARETITITELLSHSSGLTYGDSGIEELDQLYVKADLYNESITLKTMVQRIANLPLFYHPGEGWHYSVATDVIGHLIEIVSDVPLIKFLRENIFAPLEMTDTAYFVPEQHHKRLATLYSFDANNTLVEVDAAIGGSYTKEIQLTPGGYGLVSTISDYYQFCQMLLNNGTYKGNQILKHDTIELMTKNIVNEALFPISYNGITNDLRSGIGFGLGFRVLTNSQQAGLGGNDGSYGWGGMANTMFWIDPKEKLIAILLTQCTTDDVHPVRNAFHSLVYETMNQNTNN